MSWLAVLLALAVGAASAPREHRVPKRLPYRQFCVHAQPKKKPRCKPSRPRPAAPGTGAVPLPGAPGAPGPVATPTPTATPTATPAPLPSRTGVDLKEWSIVSNYRTLKAGEVEFNATNLGEDDHNLTVSSPDETVQYGQVDLPPDGETYPLRLTLAAGTYKLWCTLPDHEALGMHTTVTLR